MSKHLQPALLIAVAFIAWHCAAPNTTVVLVPDPGGEIGQVTVSNTAGNTLLNEAYQATTVAAPTKQPSEPVHMEKAAVATIFSDAIAAQPLQPVHFILYFETGTTDLTLVSERLIPEILSAIQKRNATDIIVVGHTDTAGDREYNIELSKKRAYLVSSRLISQGVNPLHIRTTSHGEENPLIKTGDNVREPKNRRVEVVVR